MIKKASLLFVALLLWSGGALAQSASTIPQFSIPVGRGPGVSAWASVGPCLTGIPILGAGVSANPACTALSLSGTAVTGTLPVARGGTNCGAASGTCIDNISGFASTGIMSRTGAGAYSFSTLTTLMDVIGSTRGSILIRGSSGWVILTPGTSGNVLTSNGVGADPSYNAVAGTGTVTSVTITAGNGISVSGTCPSAITGSGTCAVAVDKATNSNVWSETSNKVLTTDIAASALAPVALTDAATIALDLNTFINGSVTIAGNRTLGNPTNIAGAVGRCGRIYITQDATGTRTLAYSSFWKFAGGVAPVLTTTAAAVDILSYCVRTSVLVDAALNKDFK